MGVRRRTGPGGAQTWIVDFWFTHPDDRRERIRLRSPVQTRRGAEEYERRVRSELLAGTFRKEEEKVPTLAEFEPRWIEGYALANRQKHSEVTSKRSILRNHLKPALGDKRLDEITEEDISRLKGRLRDKSPKTVNNVLTVLNTLLRVAVEWNVIPRMPVRIRLVKAPPAKLSFLDDENFERLAEGAGKAGPEKLAAVLLLGEGGLRAGEAMGLEWGDVDFRRGQITVRRTVWRGVTGAPKGGRERIVPMTARLAAALGAIRHLRGPRVFYRPNGKPLTQKTLQVWMQAAQRRAGLPVDHGKLHILRHTFCARLAMAGAPAKAIQELAGHVNLSTTQRYMHLSPQARDGAIRLLERRDVAEDPVGHQVGTATSPARPIPMIPRR